MFVARDAATLAKIHARGQNLANTSTFVARDPATSVPILAPDYNLVNTPTFVTRDHDTSEMSMKNTKDLDKNQPTREKGFQIYKSPLLANKIVKI